MASRQATIKNRSLELRFLFLFPKDALTQAKALFPQPLALLSPCGGIGGERINEGGAQAAGLAEIAAAASIDVGDAGALRPLLHQIGADKTVGAARGVERGARLAKGEAYLDLALPLMARDRAGREDLRAQQVIPGVGQEGVALDKGRLLVRGLASGYLPRPGGGIEQAEQLGGDDVGQRTAQVCLIEAARFDAALPDQKLGHLGTGTGRRFQHSAGGGVGMGRNRQSKRQQGPARYLHGAIFLMFDCMDGAP